MGACEPGQGLTAAAISSRPCAVGLSSASGLPPHCMLPRTMSLSMEPSVEKSALEGEPASDAGTAVAAATGYQWWPAATVHSGSMNSSARNTSPAACRGRSSRAGSAMPIFSPAPAACGKTSARPHLMPRRLNAPAGPRRACNVCDSCVAIAAGQDVDVVEIDAASNRGIDEMRQLRQNVAVRPARGHYKTYIIDEVHMLTRRRSTALLKTLEEPPAHVKFVLCTTEPDKLPITILSRASGSTFRLSIRRRSAAAWRRSSRRRGPRSLPTRWP